MRMSRLPGTQGGQLDKRVVGAAAGLCPPAPAQQLLTLDPER